MRNSISHIFRHDPRRARGWGTAREVDQLPELRLWVIYLAMLLPVLGIMARLAHVQLILPPRYVAELERSRTREEIIPTLNGRIISSDGTLLARDVELFDLQVHYRWLEQPPNPLWLKQLARSRLNRNERRRKERVQDEERTLLRERERLWQRIAELAELPLDEVAARRRKIQRQIEHIRNSVQERQHARIEQSRPDLSQASTWKRLWHLLADTILTAADKAPEITQVVREELDYHHLLTDIPRQMALEIQSHPETYPGLRITRSSRREYPAGPLAAHLVGYRKRLDDEGIRERKQRYPSGDPLDYGVGDWAGETGLEKYYETALRGLRGLKRVTLDWRGEILSEETLRAPRPGRDLQLSLHAPLQLEIETILDRTLNPESDPQATETATSAEDPASPDPVPRGACLAIMDIRTGELIAAASAPHFDLQLMVEHDSEEWQRISNDNRHPLFPRLTRMQLPPGSVFKTLTSLALLELPGFNPDEEFFCQGYLTTPAKFRCLSFTHNGVGHDATDLTRAMAQSCNVYFFSLAPQLGRKNLSEWGARLGFGTPTGIDLPGESRGNLPRSRQLDLRGLAIGQGELLVTPLQILRMMAAVANDGKLVTPHLVQNTPALPDSLSPGSTPSRTVSFPREPIPDLSSHTLQRLREALAAVVAHPQGTAHRTLYMRELPVAGKTGTAETQGKPDHAWFAGYFPADRPRYAVVTILEHGGSGGRAAGPPTRLAVEAMLHLGLLTPSRTPTPQTAESE